MIQIYPDFETLSRAAAELFVEQAKQAIAERGRFGVALSGGHTPKRTFEILAQPLYLDQVDWSKVHVFWGDERCVPSSDPRSNERMARLALLDHVPIPASQIHAMGGTGSPQELADRYEAVLKNYFAGQPPRLDLVYLGLGDNGHTLSLFPGTPVLDERQRWVREVYVPEQNMDRVTMTAPFANQAHVLAFVVSGKDKAAVVKQILDGGPNAPRLPAQLIQPVNGELRWLLDRDAAV